MTAVTIQCNKIVLNEVKKKNPKHYYRKKPNELVDQANT